MTTRSQASADPPAPYPGYDVCVDPLLASLRARQANVWYVLALIAVLEILAGGWLIGMVARVGE